MADTYDQDGAVIQTKNETGGALVQGDVIVKTDSVRILMEDLANNATGPCWARGVHTLASKSADTWNDGQNIYWDDTADNLTNTSSGNTFAGSAVGDKAALETSNKVLLQAGAAATLATDAVSTPKILDDAVTNDKLANMTRGTVKVGGAANAPTDLDAKTDTQILVGDGTDIASVAVSGDATMTNAGVLTVAADAISNAKLANITRGSVKVGGAADAPTDLVAKTDGQILVGDGTDIASVAVSGDISLTNAGVTAVGAVLDGGNLANIADGEHGLPFVIQKTFPDSDGDVTIYNSNAPFKFRILDVWVENRAENGANANTVQVNAATGGASTITDVMSLNGKVDTDIIRAINIDDSDGLIAANGSLYIDVTKVAGTMGGNVNILAIRSA